MLTEAISKLNGQVDLYIKHVTYSTMHLYIILCNVRIKKDNAVHTLSMSGLTTTVPRSMRFFNLTNLLEPHYWCISSWTLSSLHVLCSYCFDKGMRYCFF